MSSAVYAFVFNGEDNWKIAPVDDWEFTTIELVGNEKTLGHRKIDGATYKVLLYQDDKIIAVST